jgi:hypothetical protein
MATADAVQMLTRALIAWWREIGFGTDVAQDDFGRLQSSNRTDLRRQPCHAACFRVLPCVSTRIPRCSK